MPSGQSPADGQVSWDGQLLTGAGTVYHILNDPGIQGVFDQQVKTRDFELEGQQGSIAAGDYEASGLITIPYVIVEATEAAAYTALDTLRSSTGPSTNDNTLWFKFPNITEFGFTGKNRGLSGVSLRHTRSGAAIFCLAAFMKTNTSRQA
jgi:hypothetical protein